MWIPSANKGISALMHTTVSDKQRIHALRRAFSVTKSGKAAFLIIT